MWFTKIRSYPDRIRASAALGFPAVEFWPYEGKDLDAMAAAAKETGIELAQFTAWGFKPGMNDPKTTTTSRRKSARPARSPTSSTSKKCALSAATTPGHDAGRDAREHHQGPQAARRRSPRTTR